MNGKFRSTEVGQVILIDSVKSKSKVAEIENNVHAAIAPSDPVYDRK